MAEIVWADGQPNVAAGVGNDQILILDDGRTIHVRHDPLSPPDYAWYIAGLAEVRGHSYGTRERAKSLVEALVR